MSDSTLSLSSNLSDDLSLLSPTTSQYSTSSVDLNPELNTDSNLFEKEYSLNRDVLPEELPIVQCVARARIPTTNNTEIFLHLYSNNIDKKEHLAIVFGENIRSKSLYQKRENETQSDRMIRGAYIGKLHPNRKLSDFDELNKMGLQFNQQNELIYDNKTSYNPENPILVRIHSECYTGETTWSARCDCGEQFDEAGRMMGQYGQGVIIYLRQEGRGIGLGEKLKAYNLQDLGADTVQANLMLRHPADARSFSLATSILRDLNLPNIKLLTNNPDKILAVEGKNRSIKVVERIPMIPLAWKDESDNNNQNDSNENHNHNHNHNHGIKSKEINGYLRTKIQRMGHLLQEPIRI